MRTLSLSALTKIATFALPFLFILMWSSGYVVGKIAIPYAGPFTLLFLRFGSAAAILLVVAIVMRTPWPHRAIDYVHLIVVGLLIQVLQFFGVYTALKLGVSAGIAALFIGTMPILTALGARIFLNEELNKKQWGGLIAGLIGVCMVVANKFGTSSAGIAGYSAIVLGLFGITLGTLYQKRFCSDMDLRIAGFVQLSFASMISLFFAGGFEGFEVHWSASLIFATAWLSIVNSIGAISLLFLMMRKGEASKVASLFYLIPGVSAVMGYMVLGETLSSLAAAGFAVTGIAVYFCTHKSA
jgi:drug/metabolite transporter (DMT)-like permease